MTQTVYLIKFTWCYIAECYINSTAKCSLAEFSQFSSHSTAYCVVFAIIYAYQIPRRKYAIKVCIFQLLYACYTGNHRSTSFTGQGYVLICLAHLEELASLIKLWNLELSFCNNGGHPKSYIDEIDFAMKGNTSCPVIKFLCVYF